MLLLIQHAAPLSQQQLNTITARAEVCACGLSRHSQRFIRRVRQQPSRISVWFTCGVSEECRSTTSKPPDGSGQLPQATPPNQAHGRPRPISRYSFGSSLFSRQFERGLVWQVLLSSGGDGVAADLPTAASLFEAAALAGHSTAQRNLAVCYRHGNGVLADQLKAEAWLRKAAAAGSAEAVLELAELLSESAALSNSATVEAIALWRQAANKGSARAMHQLAVAHMKGTMGTVDIKVFTPSSKTLLLDGASPR